MQPRAPHQTAQQDSSNKKRPNPGDGQAAELKKLAAKDKKNTQVAKAKKAVKEREETTIRTHAYQCGAREEAAEHQVRLSGW